MIAADKHELDPVILSEIRRGATEHALDSMGHTFPEGIAETEVYVHVSREDTEEEMEGLEYLLEETTPGFTLTAAEQTRYDRLSDLFDQKRARQILGLPADAEILNQ